MARADDRWSNDPLPIPPSAARAQLVAALNEVEPIVRGICRRQLGSHAGDDVAQQVLMRVWANLSAGREFDDLRAYAAASAKLAARPTRGRQPVPIGDAADRWTDLTPGPAEQYERKEQTEAAEAAVDGLLGRLTPREAQVLRARSLDERETVDIAEELGVTPSTVRTAHVRGMARMREMLGTRSTNPLASDRPLAEREREQHQRARARYAEQDQHPGLAEANRNGRPGSVRQRGGAFQVILYVGRDDATGKERYLSGSTRDWEQVEDLREDLIRQRDDERRNVPDAAEPDPRPTRSAEDAARILARNGRSLEQARAMVGTYLDSASARVGLPVHDAGLDDADIAAIDTARGAPTVSAAEEERREQLTRWHADDTATEAGTTLDDEAVRS